MGIRRESNNEGPLGKLKTDANGNLIIPGKPSTPTPNDATGEEDEQPPEPKPDPDAQETE